MKTVLLAIAAMLIALPPIAQADTQDDQFLAALSADGIQAAPDQLFGDGHATCNAFDYPIDIGINGPTANALMLQAHGLSPAQVRPFMHDALKAYCPDKYQQYMAS
jgi:Protein of unknown function (DUF732)